MTSKIIRFVTDSVCDIPEDLVKKWDITVVPCYINYGGHSYADDGVELVRETYYNDLPAMSETPKTSAMSPEIAREGIEAAWNDGATDHVIIITTPASLSGIHNAMRLALQDFPQDHVTLIDSGQLSMGIGWQVLVGAEVAAESGDVEHTLAAIQKVRRRQKVWAGLDTLEYLRRSGRVGWAVANIGQLLQIKPLVEVDGDVTPVARIRTFSRMLDKLEQFVREQAPLEKLAVLHINNPAAEAELLDRLADIAPPDTMTGLIGPTLGTHIGPGSIGAAVLSKTWRE